MYDAVVVLSIVLFFFCLYWICQDIHLVPKLLSIGVLLVTAWTTIVYIGTALISILACCTGGDKGKKLYLLWTKQWYNWWFRVNVHNRNVLPPPEQRCIIIAQHFASGNLDVMSLPIWDLPNVRIVHSESRSHSPLKPVLKLLNGIPIRHGGSYDHFLEECSRELDNGYNLLVYPEGKNSMHKIGWYDLSLYQTGVFQLSINKQIPIVPLVVSGSCETFGMLQPGQIDGCFLPPIWPHRFQNATEMKDFTWSLVSRALHLL